MHASQLRVLLLFLNAAYFHSAPKPMVDALTFLATEYLETFQLAN